MHAHALHEGYLQSQSTDLIYDVHWYRNSGVSRLLKKLVYTMDFQSSKVGVLSFKVQKLQKVPK